MKSNSQINSFALSCGFKILIPSYSIQKTFFFLICSKYSINYLIAFVNGQIFIEEIDILSFWVSRMPQICLLNKSDIWTFEIENGKSFFCSLFSWKFL